MSKTMTLDEVAEFVERGCNHGGLELAMLSLVSHFQSAPVWRWQNPSL